MISSTQLKACTSEWDTRGEDIDVRKDIGHSNHIALSGKVTLLREYVTQCLKSCISKSEIVPMVEESVMAVCFTFLLVVLEYNATTIIVIGMSGVKRCL